MNIRVRPTMNLRQLSADIGVLAWCLAWAWVGRSAGARVESLNQPLKEFSRSMANVTAKVDEILQELAKDVLIGKQLANTLNPLSEFLHGLQNQLNTQAQAIAGTGFWIFMLVWLSPTLTLLAMYLPRRIRSATDAIQTRRFIDAHADVELFALRALANCPMKKLAAISPEPLSHWKAGNAQVIQQLADLELQRVGVGRLEGVGQDAAPASLSYAQPGAAGYPPSATYSQPHSAGQAQQTSGNYPVTGFSGQRPSHVGPAPGTFLPPDQQ